MNTFHIVGFDRRNFVNDIAHAIPQNERCRITGLSFEADGIRAAGRLTVDTLDEPQLATIRRQLRAIRGLVSINEIN